METIDDKGIADIYNKISEIWVDWDLWHSYTNDQISKFINKHPFNCDDYVLNAGSGGNNYLQNCKMHHVDVAIKKIKTQDNYTVASIENLPFENGVFDGILCVGSVINYCSAMEAISEFARTIKYSGKLILEFENSFSYEYKNKPEYGATAKVVGVTYQNQQHCLWVYSYKYIFKILKMFNFKIVRSYTFHIYSSYILGKGTSEEEAVRYAKYDKILQHVPFVRNHGCNVIVECVRL